MIPSLAVFIESGNSGTAEQSDENPSERDAIDWINAHPNLTKPEDRIEQAAAAFLGWRESQKAKDK